MRIASLLLAATAFLLQAASADLVYSDSSAYSSGSLGLNPVQTYQSSTAQPPAVNILTKEEVGSNYTFLAYRGSATSTTAADPSPVILDVDGKLVWSGEEYGKSMDLTVQMLNGEPVLTFFQGSLYAGGYGEGYWAVLAQNYTLLRTIMTLNQTENTADFHECVITEDDTALVESWRVTEADLSSVNGSASGWTWDCVFQEIDLSDNSLLFEWRSLEHVPISETYFGISDNAGNSSSNAFDYCHINSLEKDSLGNYLVSMRGPSTIYYIEGTSGEILWRLGGKSTNFTMGDNTSFWYQHFARFQSDPSVSPITLSVFDNAVGGGVDIEPTARGLVLSLDTEAWTATFVAEYKPSFNATSASQGNMDVLANGNVVIGWGSTPYYSEYSSNGTLLYDVEFAAPNTTMMSYRAHRFAWEGKPTTNPSMAHNATTNSVYASWNGATNVTSWSLLGGSSASSLSALASATKDGFETAFALSTTATFYAVAALGADGSCIGASEIYASANSSTTGHLASCSSSSSASSSTASTSDASRTRLFTQSTIGSILLASAGLLVLA